MIFDLDRYKIVCESSVAEFEKSVIPFSYIESGISPLESFSWYAMAKYVGGIDLIIESGVAGGASTEMFAKAFTNIPIFAIELGNTYSKELYNNTYSRLAKYKNVQFIKGDALNEVLPIITKHTDKKIGIFFDGPKGKVAMNLANKCFSHKNVMFYGQHDTCHKIDYHNMDSWRKTVLYTDTPWFSEKYKYLNGESFNRIETDGMGLALN